MPRKSGAARRRRLKEIDPNYTWGITVFLEDTYSEPEEKKFRNEYAATHEAKSIAGCTEVSQVGVFRIPKGFFSVCFLDHYLDAMAAGELNEYVKTFEYDTDSGYGCRLVAIK